MAVVRVPPLSPPAKRGAPACADSELSSSGSGEAIGGRALRGRVTRRSPCPDCGGRTITRWGLLACRQCWWCEAEGVDDIYD